MEAGFIRSIQIIGTRKKIFPLIRRIARLITIYLMLETDSDVFAAMYSSIVFWGVFNIPHPAN